MSSLCLLNPTHLLHKGKYHCMTNLLFDWLGFSYFACVELDRDLQVWSNPNQSNRRSAMQWYFPFEVSECSLLCLSFKPSLTVVTHSIELRVACKKKFQNLGKFFCFCGRKSCLWRCISWPEKSNSKVLPERSCWRSSLPWRHRWWFWWEKAHLELS